MGINDGGAISQNKGGVSMVILPITQLQLFLSMIVAEVMLLSDPNYTVKIGSENYFSLAVAAFVAGVVLFVLLAIKLSSVIQFKESIQKATVLSKVNRK